MLNLAVAGVSTWGGVWGGRWRPIAAGSKKRDAQHRRTGVSSEMCITSIDSSAPEHDCEA